MRVIAIRSNSTCSTCVHVCVCVQGVGLCMHKYLTLIQHVPHIRVSCVFAVINILSQKLL